MSTKEEILESVSDEMRDCFQFGNNLDLFDGQASTVFSAMDIYAKQESIEFFNWYVFKMTGFLEYLKDVKPSVTSNEIEESLKAFEGKSFNELYELYQQSKIKP